MYNQSNAMNFFRNNILYMLVIINFLTTSLVLIYQGTGYWYDEIITTEISKYAASNIIQTIYGEPHPPGFYFILKALPVDNHLITKISISLLNHALLLICILFANKSGLTKKYHLKPGFVVLLTSPFWVEATSYIKQDSFSLPLLVLGILLGASHLETNSNKSFLGLASVCILSLTLGYINFAKVLIILFVSAIKKTSRLKTFSVIFVLIIIVLYGLLFGHKQLETNAGRFTWQKDQFQGITKIYYRSLGGELDEKHFLYLADIVFITGIFFIIQLKDTFAKYKNFLFIYLLALVTYFLVAGVARNRYIYELLVIYAFVVGWGMSKVASVNKNGPRLVIFALIIFYINSAVYFMYLNSSIIAYKNQSLAISAHVGEVKTGVIERHPIEAYIRKAAYFKQKETAIPINPYFQINNNNEITMSLLALDGSYIELSQETIETNIQSTGLDRFIYIVTDTSKWGDFNSYYDPNQNVLRALNSLCNESNYDFFQSRFVIIFEDCNNIWNEAT